MQREQQGADPRSVRHWNEIVVLETLHRLGTARIRAINEVTGITPGPLGQVLSGLVGKGWVTAEQALIEGPGRPAQIYSIAWPRGVVIGLDLGRHSLRAVCVDISGELRACVEGELPEDGTREQIATLCRELVDAVLTGEESQQVWAAAIAVSGRLSADGGLEASQALPALEGTNPATLFEGRLDVPVTVVADGRAAMVAENRHGVGREAEEFMLMSLSDRVNFGVMVGGLPRRGAHNTAGDVSRLPLHHALDASGWAGADGSSFPTLVAGIDAVAAGDAGAIAGLHADLDRMAPSMATAVAIFDPDVLAIGGAARPVAPLVIDHLQSRFEQLLEAPPALLPAEVDQFGPARGACELARFRVLATLGSRETGLLEFSREEFHRRVERQVEVG